MRKVNIQITMKEQSEKVGSSFASDQENTSLLKRKKAAVKCSRTWTLPKKSVQDDWRNLHFLDTKERVLLSHEYSYRCM